MSNASRGWKNKIFKALFSNFLKNKKKDWNRINSLNWRDELFGSSTLKSEEKYRSFQRRGTQTNIREKH